MKRYFWIWAVPIVLYGLFTYWYTNFSGPLTAVETELYMARFEKMGYDAERLARVRRFMEEDKGRDFLIVNLIDMKETPDRVAGLEPGQTSEEVLERYTSFIIPEILKRGGHPVVFGMKVAPAVDLIGFEDKAGGARYWDQGALVRYRSRRDAVEIMINSGFEEAHRFKVASMEKTIAVPIEPTFYPGDLRIFLGLFLFSLSVILHFLFIRPKKRAARAARGMDQEIL